MNLYEKAFKKSYSFEDESLTDISGVASAYGTTGMMPSAPRNTDEYQNLQELASMEIPKIKPEANKKETNK